MIAISLEQTKTTFQFSLRSENSELYFGYKDIWADGRTDIVKLTLEHEAYLSLLFLSVTMGDSNTNL